MGRKSRKKKEYKKQVSAKQTTEQNLQKARSQKRLNISMLVIASVMLIFSLGFMTRMAMQSNQESPTSDPTPSTTQSEGAVSIVEEWNNLRQYDHEAKAWRNAALEITSRAKSPCVTLLHSMIRNGGLMTPTEIINQGGNVTLTENQIHIEPGNKALIVIVPPGSYFAKRTKLSDKTPALFAQDMRTVFLLRRPLHKLSKAYLFIHEGIHVLEDMQGTMTHNRRPSILTFIRSEREAHVNALIALDTYTEGKFRAACDRAAPFVTTRGLNNEEILHLQSSFPSGWFNEPADTTLPGLLYPLVGFHRILKMELPVHADFGESANLLEGIGYELNLPNTNLENEKKALALLIECDIKRQSLMEQKLQGLITQQEFYARYKTLAQKWKQVTHLAPNYSSGWIYLCKYYEACFLKWVEDNPGKPFQGAGQPFEPQLLECTKNWFDLRQDDVEAYEYRIFALVYFGDKKEARKLLEFTKKRFGSNLTPAKMNKLESYFR